MTAHRASDGQGFQIGQTGLYVGPGIRGTKAPAVLAHVRPGEKKPKVVADFRSSAAAERFVAALQAGIDELRAQYVTPEEASE
jgi:hypothetical protein